MTRGGIWGEGELTEYEASVRGTFIVASPVTVNNCKKSRGGERELCLLEGKPGLKEFEHHCIKETHTTSSVSTESRALQADTGVHT